MFHLFWRHRRTFFERLIEKWPCQYQHYVRALVTYTLVYARIYTFVRYYSINLYGTERSSETRINRYWRQSERRNNKIVKHTPIDNSKRTITFTAHPSSGGCSIGAWNGNRAKWIRVDIYTRIRSEPERKNERGVGMSKPTGAGDAAGATERTGWKERIRGPAGYRGRPKLAPHRTTNIFVHEAAFMILFFYFSFFCFFFTFVVSSRTTRTAARVTLHTPDAPVARDTVY